MADILRFPAAAERADLDCLAVASAALCGDMPAPAGHLVAFAKAGQPPLIDTMPCEAIPPTD